MFKKITNIFFASLITLLIFAPALAGAQLVDESEQIGGIVPCGNLFSPIETDLGTGQQTGGEITNPCDFNYAIYLINKLINIILFQFVVPIAAIMFCYAGFLLLFSGGNSEKKSQAKKIFVNVAIGIVFAAGAWLIIHTISEILGYDGSWIGF